MLKVNIENITKSDSNFAPTFVDHHELANKTFNEHCLINNSISVPKKVTNLYISYILSPWLGNSNTDFTLNNCSFGSVDLTKNAEPDKYNIVDVILVQNFHLQMQEWEKMALFFLLI